MALKVGLEGVPPRFSLRKKQGRGKGGRSFCGLSAGVVRRMLCWALVLARAGKLGFAGTSARCSVWCGTPSTVLLPWEGGSGAGGNTSVGVFLFIKVSAVSPARREQLL